MTEPCRNREPHVHRIDGTVMATLTDGCHALYLDGRCVAVLTQPAIAERVAELLVRHGLLDVTDTVADL